MKLFCLKQCMHVPLNSRLQVIVTDTAGMRQTLDPIEAEGVAVAHEMAQQADVILSVLDCVTWLNMNSNHSLLSETDTLDTASQTFRNAVSMHPKAVNVLNKADALTQQQLQQLQVQQQQQQCKEQSGTEQSQQQQQQSSAHYHNDQPNDLSAQQTQLQQHADWQMQQQGLDKQQQQHQQKHTALSTGASQLQSMHSMRTVLCSCKTGWNMDGVVRALEQSVQGTVQSGQDSEEALVITRYSVVIKAAYHHW